HVRPFSDETENRAAMFKVEVRSLSRLAIIHQAVTSHLDSPESRRGFVAGFFDAEGSRCRKNLRMVQKDPSVLRRVATYAAEAGFRFQEEQRTTGCPSIRLLGRPREHMRFFSWARTAIARKTAFWEGREAEGEEVKVLAIEPGPAREVIDIQTSSRTF